MPKPLNMIAIAGFIACSSPNSSTPVDAPNRAADAAINGTDASTGSGSGSGSGSAVTFGFACAGNTTPPANIPSTVAVTGSAGSLNTDLTSLAAMMFVTSYAGPVELCSGEPCTSANLLGSATAGSDGVFSFTLATNNAPVAGYVEIPASGSGSAATLQTLSYVGTPYVKATAVPFIVLVPQAAIAAVAQNAGGQCTTGAGLGFVAYKAVDCSGNVVTDSANVHGTLTQASGAVGDAPIDVYQTILAVLSSAGLTQFNSLAAPLQGIFIACGVPAGETTLNVSYASSGGNVAFLPVTVLAVGSAATEVAAQPGY
jgi:hypothetical protein